ncbi:LuxR C-terminal-related transcriptional regulator [Mycobacterium sp. URHB0021]
MTSAVDAAVHERAAIRAYLLGADGESTVQWEAAQRAALAAGDPGESARYAFWLGFLLLLRGQMALASGWLARAEGLVAESGTGCRASGYVLIPAALTALESGDPHRSHQYGVQASEIGDRFGDADLCAFGGLCQGQALIALGDPDKGVARLDEVMVAVTTGELGSITAGIVYCAVVLECMALFDLRRAAEWTDALEAWCHAQPDRVPFRGQCLVHRSQVQQAEGDWHGAIASAESACRHLAHPLHPALGLASYQEGELHRLVGKFDRAEHAYRRAARNGYDPMPGLALLQLGRGDGVAAAATIQRCLHERGSSPRATLLAAAVEIFRTTGDFALARMTADELSAIAARSTSEVLQAMAAQATASVLMATGDPAAALIKLRSAAATWRTHHMPYEAACTAVLLGLACAALGDQSGAEMEFESARDVFATLGAAPDLARVTELSAGLAHHIGPPGESIALSAREREVLAHLAAGRTNREIAEMLVVSPHTVARHIEHIYAKLGVPNRAAATAYAYAHHLV